MVALGEGAEVAKKSQHGGPRPGSGRPKSGRDDATAKIDRGVLSMAQMVAKRRKITVAEYLTGVAEATVRRDFLKAMKEVEAEQSKSDDK